tara:strand:+ start:286 stop:936 length:651 start_codon:yes stop_codon:yes gene_type:complete
MKILLTGSSGGIGQSILEKISSSENEIIAPSSTELDLSCIDKINSFMHNINVDAVIHAAGINQITEFSDLNEKIIFEHLKVNAISLVGICKNLKKENKIINVVAISSLYGFTAREMRLPYITSKHALEGIVKSLSIDLSPNVLINSIRPGFVDTPMTRKNNSEEKIKQIINKIPAGDLVDSNQIALFTKFLIENNTSMTGQSITIDGGYSAGGYEK